jgi:hypothetical protein
LERAAVVLDESDKLRRPRQGVLNGMSLLRGRF